jgi:hypothetical protein
MKTLLALATLGLAQFLIFFREPGHFFMGDSIIWIRHRHQSIGEFLQAFVSVDHGHWYRPLAQRVVPSLLYPLVGLEPLAYRLVGFGLFFSCTVLFYLLALRLSESRRVAWLAVLFFATQSTHAFVTYDVAFTPELLLFLFYSASGLAYLAFVRTQNRRMLWGSAILLLCALLSKETAVALPFTILCLWFFTPGKTRPSWSSVAPHFLVLALYLTAAIGFLHVREIELARILEQPDAVGGKGYTLVAGPNAVDNLQLAVRWAFGLPQGPQSGDPPLGQRTGFALQIFRATITAGAVFVMFTERRRLLLLGIAWFLTALAPTLPLIDHFMPYYLFVPLAGFALAVAIVLDWLYERLSHLARSLAAAPIVLLLVMTIIQTRLASEIQENHYVLGQSARNARNSLNDLKTLYPALPKGATLLVRNEELPAVDWDQGYGQVFQLGFNDPSIVTRYTIDGATATVDELQRGNTFVLQWSNGRLVDRTPMTLQRPDVFLQPTSAFHSLELSALEVQTGDSYKLRVHAVRDWVVEVLYALNDTVMDPFQTVLDQEGSVTFTTTTQTKPGRYTFLAFRRVGETYWSLVDRSITVK